MFYNYFCDIKVLQILDHGHWSAYTMSTFYFEEYSIYHDAHSMTQILLIYVWFGMCMFGLVCLAWYVWLGRLGLVGVAW